jgi:hypothetical protein
MPPTIYIESFDASYTVVNKLGFGCGVTPGANLRLSPTKYIFSSENRYI